MLSDDTKRSPEQTHDEVLPPNHNDYTTVAMHQEGILGECDGQCSHQQTSENDHSVMYPRTDDGFEVDEELLALEVTLSELPEEINAKFKACFRNRDCKGNQTSSSEFL